MYVFYTIIVAIAFIFYFLLKNFNPIIRIGIPVAFIIILSLIFLFFIKRAVQIDAEQAGKEWTSADFSKLRQELSQKNKIKQDVDSKK